MKIAWFDCSSGIAGNMVLGCLFSAGLSQAAWRREMARVGLPIRVRVSRVRRGAVVGTHVDVRAPARDQERRLSEITRIIRRAGLPQQVIRRSLEIFERLARAEGRVHGLPAGKVHLHEVGGYDCIIDIVGSVLGLELLGVEQVLASAVNLGQGRVKFSHGEFPVPAPAVAELLKGVPLYQSAAETGELTTPTGAAILTGLATGYGPLPRMRVDAVGLGAGSRRTPENNLLRVFVGKEDPTSGDKTQVTSPERPADDAVIVVETNIDDMNPELFGHVMDELFRNGALDVFYIPVQMKKNRPGVLLTAVAPEPAQDAVCRVILTETTSLGVRYRTVARRCLSREVVSVETRFGPIRVKSGRLDGRVVTRAPEHDDCRQAARKFRVPLKQVYEEAQAQALSPNSGASSICGHQAGEGRKQ